MHTYLQMLFSNYTLLPVVLLYFAKSIIPIQHAIKVQLGLERSLFWSKTQCVLSDGYLGCGVSSMLGTVHDDFCVGLTCSMQ